MSYHDTDSEYTNMIEMRADWEQQQENEKRRAEEDAAWKAHIEYCFGLAYHKRARGFGSGQTYEEHGPEVMGSDGKFHREQRLK